MSKNKLANVILDKNEVIRIENLSFRYGSKSDNLPYAVKNFNFSFKQNLIYCICGSSGSGKSTLVSHFNGLLKSKNGNIWVKDIYIDPRKKKIKQFKLLRRYVSMVFQFAEYQLFKSTIEKDIMFGPLSLGINKETAKKNAEINLNKLGLASSYLTRSPFDLSGGQKRRVAIAGVLAIDSDIVIFDEPTAGLDPESENDLLQIILNEKKHGKTIIVISHHMDHILRIADHVLVMKNGELIGDGEPYEVFSNDALLESAGLYKPDVIKIIDYFVQENQLFKKLYQYKPIDLKSLAHAIDKVVSTNV